MNAPDPSSTRHPTTPPEAKFRGPTVQDMLDTETVPVPWALRQEEFTDLGVRTVDPARYTSAEFFQREVDDLWSRVWQLACLEQDIPNVGDTIVYEIVDWSFLVVRSAPDRIQAFWNSCRHRGRKLRTNDCAAAKVPEFRCPFHGLAWNLDGTFKEIPRSFEWDMDHMRADEFGLPEVRCDTWDGFVFINPDDDAGPLADHIGDLAKHFERWPFANRWKAAHIAKVIPANWKTTAEAFLESFHVVATHPQMFAGLLGGDGSSCEYDVYSGGDAMFNRMILNGPMPNPNLPYEVTEEELIEEMFFRGGVQTENGDAAAEATDPTASAEQSALGSTAREVMTQFGGRGSAQGMTVAGSPPTLVEKTSSIQYFLFPNVCPWSGSIFYRFRPYGRETEKAIMEVMFLVHHPADTPRPPAAPMHWLSEEQDWTEAAELGPLAEIFNQDSANLPHVQRGLHSARHPLTLTVYGDSRIAHLHHLLDRFLDR
jgi:nitrite reductase/ring-hydroxylating ferredoxin subunit